MRRHTESRLLDTHLYLLMRPKGHPWRRRWASLRERGDLLCPEWADFLTFARAVDSEIGHPPSPACFLLRNEYTRGFEPGNIRWAELSVLNESNPDTMYIREVGAENFVDHEEELEEYFYAE